MNTRITMLDRFSSWVENFYDNNGYYPTKVFLENDIFIELLSDMIGCSKHGYIRELCAYHLHRGIGYGKVHIFNTKNVNINDGSLFEYISNGGW